MAIKFDFYETPQPGKGAAEDRKKYHARVVEGKIVEMKDIVANISHRCTLSDGDIHGVIVELANEIKFGLKAGDRVNIPGIGQFYLSLSVPKDANPSKTHAQGIEVKNIEFSADQQLKQELQAKAEFERTAYKRHSADLTDEEIDARLIDYFKHHHYINRAQFEKICGFIKTTALRHLRRLVGEGKIVNTNTKRQPNYEPTEAFAQRIV